MTKSEAIKIIKQFRDRQGNSIDDNEALDLAIKSLESYNKIIEQLEDEADYAYADFGSYADEYGIDKEYDEFYHKGLQRAIEVIRKELRNDNN